MICRVFINGFHVFFVCHIVKKSFQALFRNSPREILNPKTLTCCEIGSSFAAFPLDVVTCVRLAKWLPRRKWRSASSRFMTRSVFLQYSEGFRGSTARFLNKQPIISWTTQALDNIQSRRILSNLRQLFDSPLIFHDQLVALKLKSIETGYCSMDSFLQMSFSLRVF